MPRYALYVRKSDDRKEATEKSNSEQLAEGRTLAARDGLAIVVEYEESKTARNPGVRPLYSQMIRRIEKGQIDGIIAWKINRLVRNMEEGGKLAQLLIDGKIKEIRTPHQIFRQGDNILPLVLEAATSTQYSLDLTDTVSRGMRGHFERGGWNGKAYVGYKNERDPMNRKVGIVVPDHDGNRFEIIKQGWQMMLTGAYSTEHVTKYMNESLGFRSRRTAKAGGKPLSKGHAWQVFRNPFYAGYVRLKGDLRKGKHEPMVTEEQFNRVQAILRDRSRTTLRPRGTLLFAYSGLMRCGHCGLQVMGDRHTLRSGLPYISYRCTNSRKSCTNRSIPEWLLEEEMKRLLTRVSVEPEILEAAFANIERELERRGEQIVEGKIAQGPALVQVQTQLERLSDMWLDGLLDDREEYLRKRNKLQQQRDDLLLRAGEWERQIDLIRQNSRRCHEFLQHAREAFLVAGPERKREILLTLCAGYRLYGPERRLEAEIEPIVREVLKVCEEVAKRQRSPKSRSPRPPLESYKIGSRSLKRSHFGEPILSGGQAEEEYEAPDYNAVVLALSACSFPELGFS